MPDGYLEDEMSYLVLKSTKTSSEYKILQEFWQWGFSSLRGTCKPSTDALQAAVVYKFNLALSHGWRCVG